MPTLGELFETSFTELVKILQELIDDVTGLKRRVERLEDKFDEIEVRLEQLEEKVEK